MLEREENFNGLSFENVSPAGLGTGCHPFAGDIVTQDLPLCQQVRLCVMSPSHGSVLGGKADPQFVRKRDATCIFEEKGPHFPAMENVEEGRLNCAV